MNLVCHAYKQPEVYALIVAAGVGSRFGAKTPKQYCQLVGRTVLEHSIAALNLPFIQHLTLVLAQGDVFGRSLDFSKVFDGIVDIVDGGTERFLSVKAGVEAVRAQGACDDDWVLIHDGVRPCVPVDDIKRLIAAVESEPVGAILATPVVDTLKLADGEFIKKTVSRERLWQAQTPQLFRLKKLEEMLVQIIDNNLLITDEASGFEQVGEHIRLVHGSRFNVKLTYPEDLRLIEQILQMQSL